MGLLKKILSSSTGLYYPQEYLCLPKESFENPLQVHLSSGGKFIKDITNEHLFVGYSPLIIALHSEINELHPADEISLDFIADTPIANLSLKLIRRQLAGNRMIHYYEAVKGKHHFTSSFNQAMLGLYNRLFQKTPGNIFLKNNLYKQVQVAYSVPRTISLVTVSNEGLYNVFPTDLHGPVGDDYYVDSLRHNGKACEQVMKAGKIIVSEMNSTAYKTVYALGKNHMQPLKEKKQFHFTDQNSENFHWPLPESALNYRELELVDSFEWGIHRLLLFKTKFMKQSCLPAGRSLVSQSILAHIHNAYASWRRRNGLTGNYLLR